VYGFAATQRGVLLYEQEWRNERTTFASGMQDAIHTRGNYASPMTANKPLHSYGQPAGVS